MTGTSLVGGTKNTVRPLEPCLILGAGIAGLVAARTLGEVGVETIVVDKGHHPGGRLATRRLDQGVCDHGAQFFTARTAEFVALLKPALAAGVVDRWSDGFPDGGGNFPDERHPRFRGKPSMGALAEWLAAPVKVQCPITIRSVATGPDGWIATTEGGTKIHARTLFLSAPLPQSLLLLDAGETRLPVVEEVRLRSFTYLPCIAMMVRLSGESAVPAPGAIYPLAPEDGEPLMWLADNRKKGVSPDVTTLTLHGGKEFSQVFFDESDADIEGELLEAAKPWLGKAKIIEKKVHRWRYAQPQHPFTEPFLRSSLSSRLYFIGDSFGGGRVEGAALSGQRAALDWIQRMAR